MNLYKPAWLRIIIFPIVCLVISVCVFTTAYKKSKTEHEQYTLFLHDIYSIKEVVFYTSGNSNCYFEINNSSGKFNVNSEEHCDKLKELLIKNWGRRGIIGYGKEPFVNINN